MMQHFRSYQLAVSFYRRAKNTQLPCHLKQQLLRASSSIALNLAEGYGRQTTQDKRRFYVIALGSTRECQAIMDLHSSESDLRNMLDIVAAHIYKLIKSQT